MKKYIARAGQVFSKFFFCLRVAADTKTFLRLLIQSKRLNRYQRKEDRYQRKEHRVQSNQDRVQSKQDRDQTENFKASFDKMDEALAYRIRYLSQKHTIYLRTYAGDIRMFYEIFWERVYWLPPAVLESPGVIVDAGAHIGMAALYFSKVYPRARIYCLEPDAPNFKLLRENLAAEAGRAELIEAALYDRDGVVGLARERWAYNSRIDERADRLPDCGVVVPAVTMDTILDRFQLSQIDLLKIDIEGTEEKLFGAPAAWLDKVNTILIEVHRVKAIVPIRSLLEGNGFRWERWKGRPRDGSLEAGKLPDAMGGAGNSLFLASRVENPGRQRKIPELANS